MPLNFGPPLIDFSPLGQLGETYDRSVKRAHDAQIAANREKALAGFGQNGDLAALGNTLLRAGDLEGGMSALRMAQAGQGTPWQREQAAKEEAYRARQEAENTRRYEESKTRADRPEYIREETNDPVTGMPTVREGQKMPDGTVRWKGDPPPVIGPQSGGLGDPNLPAPNSMQAAGQLAAEPNPNDYGVPTPNPARERGYVIPGTLEGYPHGTVRMPRDAGAPAPRAAPAQATLPAPAVAGPIAAPAPQQQASAVPLAPPAAAGPTAVAAPAQTQAQAPIQRRASRADPLEPETAPFVRWPPLNVPGKEWVAAETKRLAALSGGGGPDPAKNLGEQAGRLAVAEQYLANAPKIREAIADEKMTGFIDRTFAVNKWGERGAIQSQIESGVDALVHMMTGSGMSENEARRKVGRYEPALMDNKDSLLAKHDLLVGELKHWRELAYRGKGAAGPLPAPTPAYGGDSKPLDVGGSRDLGGGVTIKRVK